MKRIVSFSIGGLVLAIFVLFASCTKDVIIDTEVGKGEKALLNLYVGIDNSTRLAELPHVDTIPELDKDGLHNLGLYIYYKSDYDGGDLSKPYIRNLECTIEDGKLVPVLQTGEDASNKNIYIYDNMTVVVFYPYNSEMSLPENYFTTKVDEENYPITRYDYSQQTYIPYRGQVNVNPTNSFYVELRIYPKHTFKLEIILVSKNEADLKDGDPNIKLLPGTDPIDNTNTITEGKREKWYDHMVPQPNTGGGSYVRRYVAYFWQDDILNHVINRNDILFENSDFTLLASEQVNVKEQRTYRYGYNFSTGESFIPTSSVLINDAASLQAFNSSNTHVYQVCDIDLSELSNWTPLSIINSTYDGGGHKISNLTLNTSAGEAGLFGKIQGDSYLKNINLIDPVITVNSTSDTCYVGALCGRVNSMLSDEDISKMYNSIDLPAELSEVVKQALIQEMLADIFDSDSQVTGCRVENPVINVTGNNPRVGTICGSNGDRVDSYTFRGLIWDTYSLGGTISVNPGSPADNENAMIGGFCGLNQYFIGRSYTTIEDGDITAEKIEAVDDGNGGTNNVTVDAYEGFTNQGDLYTTGEGAGINECYAQAPDSNSNVQQLSIAWPSSSWIKYSGIWPINTSAWTNFSANSFWYEIGNLGGNYPILHWERR